MLHTLGWNEPPRSASALGGIVRWKDGRNMPDTHLALFDYHGVPVYVRLVLGAETPQFSRYYGPKGILEATAGELKHIPQSGVDNSPSYYSASFPGQMRDQYTRQWWAEHAVTPGREPIGETAIYQGHDWDDLRPHLWTFFQAVKSRQPVAEDAVFGNHAVLACHMANESYFRKTPVTWDGASGTIKG